MCGRYTIVDSEGVRRWLPAGFTQKVDPGAWLKPRYNIAPSQEVPVLANDGAGLQTMRWGLVPWWSKDAKGGYKMINARCETVAEKPAYRKLVQWRRCILPADGFYEWRVEADGKTKTSMYIHMKSGETFGIAGLWDAWKDAEGKVLKTCTIVTGSPNELVRPIHDRMPVILPREAYEAWLSPGEMSAEEASRWMRPYPAEEMEAYPVSRLVNSPKNDSAELIQRV